MKTRLFSLWLLLSVAVGLSAYDIKVDGLCYNIYRYTDGYEAHVTWEQNPNTGQPAYQNLTTANIPDSVTYDNEVYRVTGIGQAAFYGCTGLTTVTIGNSVMSIGYSAFEGCTGLTTVTIGNSVMSIGYSAFKGCTSLTSVVWNAKNSYGFSAYSTPFYSSDDFDLRPQITSFVFGDSVQHIPDYVCAGMTNLTSITIGNCVMSIGENTFDGCTGLTAVAWNAKNCNDFSEKSTPFYYKGYYSSDNFDLCPQITSFVFGDSVQHIPDYLCAGIKNLTSITIPNSVTSIGDNAFKGCSSITSVAWNAKNYKGENAPFHNSGAPISTQITSFVFGDSVQYIPAGLCNGMKNLTSITIPNRVTSIGNSAFCSCTGLTSITIPNCVTSIGNSAFSCCTALTSVSIGSGVTNIGKSAFSNCSSITSITIPNGVKRIESSTFSGCKGLASVIIPNSVTDIENNAFSGCSGLTSITLPNNVISIGNGAFSSCTGLTSITIPNSVTSIGGSAFNNCIGLTSITIPNGVTSIGSSAFSSCTGLTSVVIGNGVTSIEDNAFSGCKNVEAVVFGSAVETIGASAFAGCQSIYEMTIYATKVPTIQENTFTEVGTGATLRVPAGCAKKYKAHPYWGVFNIEEIPSEYTITVTCDPQQGQVSGSGTYTDGSEVTLTATPNKGYAFTQWSDGNKDNPRKVTVTADATYTAEFALQNYVVTATCDPQHGQVTGGGTYPYGSEVTLTATPNKGYAFSQWSDGNKDNPRKVIVTADVTYMAEFVLQNHVITATCDPKHGQVTGGGTYLYGSEVTLTAVPNDGYQFTQWTDGNKDNPRKVTVTADATYTAEFALQNYVVTATCDPQHGQVTGGGTYPYGSEVTLTATPNNGYEFTQWSDGNKDNPRKVTVTADATYTAEFALQNYVVTATCDPQHGQVTGGGTYPHGSEVTLTAVPNDGYQFKQWSEGSIANPYSFSVEKDVSIEALFEPTTPVENVTAEENDTPRKVFRDGQVYILRGGKTYTITGEDLPNSSKGGAQ